MSGTSTVSGDTSVGELVVRFPGAARVFEDLNIDYCCHGRRSLAEACAAGALDAQSVLARVRAEVEQGESSEERDWSGATLAELSRHIEQTHHVWLRRELPRLLALVQKVASVHGDAHPELRELPPVVEALQAELQSHMLKEEHVLFPAIRQLEQADRLPQFPFGTVANPIRMMEHEHDSAGSALVQIRKLTHGFQAPDDACESWRAALAGLQALEADLHTHIHKENNILFPRAAELESSLANDG